MKNIPKQLLRSRTVILIFLGLAVLMVSSAWIEWKQSRKELLDLMEKQSHTLLESLLISSHNALLTYDFLESSLEDRLLNNAYYIRNLYEAGRLDELTLKRIAEANDIFRINVYSKEGKRILSSYQRARPGEWSPREILRPIFDAQTDTLLIGLKEAGYEGGYRYAVAVSAGDRSAIVLNLNAEKILNFRREIGFGSLLNNMTTNPGIVFVALQDTSGIIAASGNVSELERINESPFLSASLRDSVFQTRTASFEDLTIFEAVHPFHFEGISVGLFRMGLSLESLENIEQRVFKRILIITFILGVIGFAFFTLIMIRQTLDLTQKQYQVVETYSGSIIRRVSDAILVLDPNGIKIFNDASEILFHRKKEEVLGRSLRTLFTDSDCDKILDMSATMEQLDCTIRNHKKTLLLSKSTFEDADGLKNSILVIRDLTEQQKMEAQIQRNERLAAMGELASGVAHEIRNPLNTISTIIQQLEKDFQPKENVEEYRQLARLVYQEVQRINETVQDFLKFSRPDPLRPQKFTLSDLFNHLKQQYESLSASRGIQLTVQLNWDGEVLWDYRQMQQVFMNLMQNAIDAIGEKGRIFVTAHAASGEEIEIRLSDTGPGIPDNIQSKIFNLYFTTKAKGTGIGLSIVQRIVYDHGGIITFESERTRGTTFILNMPIRLQGDEI